MLEQILKLIDPAFAWVQLHLIELMTGAVIFAIAASFINARKETVKSIKAADLSLSILPQGIVLGKTAAGIKVYSKTQNEGYVAVFGGSGSGKTSAVLIPTLRCWGGHFFALDIAGDISENVKRNNLVVFDPTGSDAVYYDPLSIIDTLQQTDLKNEALINLTYTLLPCIAMDDNARWYEDSGRAILKAGFIALYHQGLDFTEICNSIVRADAKEFLMRIHDSGNPEALKHVQPMFTMNEKSLAGCKQAADSALELFTSPRLKRMLRRSVLGEQSFTPVSIEYFDILFKIPDHLLEQYTPLVTLIAGQILDYLSNRPINRKTKILLAIDEYASFRALDLTQPLQKLRKRNCRIMVLLQSLAQLDRNFGADARREMIDNFDMNVICNASDPDTQQYFSAKAGTRTVRNQIRDSNGTVLNITETEQQIIKPQSFARLRNHLIVISKGETLRLRNNYYYS